MSFGNLFASWQNGYQRAILTDKRGMFMPNNPQIDIHGTCDDEFGHVRETFI
jgi:hypothetical protein